MLGVVRGSQPTSIFEDNIILFQEHASRQGTCIYLHTDVLSQTICLSGAFSVVSSYHWVTALALRFIIPVAAQGHPHTSRCLISFLLREKIVRHNLWDIWNHTSMLPSQSATFPPDFQFKNLCAIFKPLWILALSPKSKKMLLHSICRCHTVVDEYIIYVCQHCLLNSYIIG